MEEEFQEPKQTQENSTDSQMLNQEFENTQIEDVQKEDILAGDAQVEDAQVENAQIQNQDEPKNLDISTLENIERPKKAKNPKTYNLLLDVALDMSAVLGETDIPLKKVLDLTKGSIIELNNKTMEPIKLLANGCEIARGEVVIVEDNFGLRITNVCENKITQ